jgi:hypothetical protein
MRGLAAYLITAMRQFEYRSNTYLQNPQVRYQLAPRAISRLKAGRRTYGVDCGCRYISPQHGDRCWEVDILPAAVIEQALDRHIHTWLDQRLWRQREREIERARILI